MQVPSGLYGNKLRGSHAMSPTTAPTASGPTTTASSTSIEPTATTCVTFSIDHAKLDGIAASHDHPDVFYVFEISSQDHHPVMYAIGPTGQLLSTIEINGYNFRSWEGLAVGKCPNSSGSCVFMLDKHKHGHDLYYANEPSSFSQSTVIQAKYYGEIRYSHICKALLVDRNTNIYLFCGQWLVKLGAGPTTDSTIGFTLYQMDTNDNPPMGADISPNGAQVLVRTRTDIFKWQVAGSLETTISDPGDVIPMESSQSGVEGITWDRDGRHFFTLSHAPDSGARLFCKHTVT